jgi:hypothetical protein
MPTRCIEPVALAIVACPRSAHRGMWISVARLRRWGAGPPGGPLALDWASVGIQSAAHDDDLASPSTHGTWS